MMLLVLFIWIFLLFVIFPLGEAIEMLRPMPSSFKPNVPMWAFTTANIDSSSNINIITYTGPLSFSPNEVWGISLFKGTLNLENFQRERRGVLQHLLLNQLDTIPLLGKTSGRTVNKVAKLHEMGHPTCPLGEVVPVDDRFSSLLVLKSSPVFICIEQLPNTEAIDVGDHFFYLCKNVGCHSTAEAPAIRQQLLHTDYYREKMPAL